MIIMKTDATQEQIDRVVKEVERYGLRADVSKGAYRTVIGPIGDEGKIPFDRIAVLPGVREAVMVDVPYKLISREYSKFSGEMLDRRIVKVGNIEIGGDEPIFIAGPCAVEGYEQLLRIAKAVSYTHLTLPKN